MKAVPLILLALILALGYLGETKATPSGGGYVASSLRPETFTPTEKAYSLDVKTGAVQAAPVAPVAPQSYCNAPQRYYWDFPIARGMYRMAAAHFRLWARWAPIRRFLGRY